MRSDSLGMNGAMKVIISSTFCTSVILVGPGSDFISSTFWGSGCVPFLSNIAPKNLTSWLIAHLLLLNVSPTVRAVSISFRKLRSCSSLVFPWIMTSSIEAKALVHSPVHPLLEHILRHN